MPRRIGVFAAAVAAAAMLASGCSSPAKPQPVLKTAPAAQASAPSTEALPGGGEIATSLENGLQFSAEVLSTRLIPGQPIAVRLVLQNVGQKAVNWDDNPFGIEVGGVAASRTTTISEGLGLGTPFSVATPVTLRSGESTTAVITMQTDNPREIDRGVEVGWTKARIYRVVGRYGRQPSGSTPEIVLSVSRR